MKRSSLFRPIAIVLLSGTVVGAAIGTALASHNFSDVPTSAIYHGAVEWLVNRAITLGCTAGLYCPDDVVTRASMALFMNRLGRALSSTVLTADYTPTSPQAAIVDGQVSVRAPAAGGLIYRLRLLYSTDGGSIWNIILSPLDTFTRHSVSANEWASVSRPVFMSALTPTTTYHFGAGVYRDSDDAGSNNPVGFTCDVRAQVVNRNPSTSPLSGPGTGSGTQRR